MKCQKKCQTKDRNSNPCRNFAIGQYCKIHSYMEEYTDEMKANTNMCSNCKLWRFMGEYDTCEDCRVRAVMVREKKKAEIVLCIKEGCKYKKTDNKYCGKHQVDYFLEQTKEAGLKVCPNYVRGCRTQNDATYTRTKCVDCLEKDREKDKTKRKTVVETEDGSKRCNACLQIFTIEDFQGKNGEMKTCKLCREANKRADEKRDKDHVQELARKNAAKPERVAVKKEWKEKNYEKMAGYWIDSRKRLIENDIDSYLKKNAEIAKNWRDSNPDKVKVINKTKINSIELQYGVYMTTSKTRRLEFSITKDEFIKKIKSPCYYCGIIQEKGFNGLDRLDSSMSYNIDNCVSCCEMCNMMKGSLGPNIFIHRIEHILTHLNIVQGKLYPSEFSDSIGSPYSKYKYRATKKDLDFKIDQELFYNKIKEPCYLCGKCQSETHNNGIDRFDNTKGYTEENIRACCGNCNYLKRDNTYDNLIVKLKLIYQHQKVEPIRENKNRQTKNIVTGNKLSVSELQLIRENRKNEQKVKLREKYSNENRKEWISDIVHKRNSTS